MKFYIMTDLEGVTGTDSFSQTRTPDTGPNGKGPSMRRLGEEVNACVRGIHRVAPGATVDVFDGHGSGGLFPEELEGCNPLPRAERSFENLRGYDGFLFVGQHAMAGTINAPLNHTFSSRTVHSYRLNGTFIGEFGMMALLAGHQGVPTIFLAGDDKAAMEAKMFVPSIYTVTTKYGLGVEKAEHRDADEVLREIEATAAAAIAGRGGVPPFTALQPPFSLEIRYIQPITSEMRPHLHPRHREIDPYTIEIRADDVVGLLR